MKRYKLLKDLPTYRAGNTIYIDKEGNLCAEDTQGTNFLKLVAYSNYTLKRFPEILMGWFEEIPEVYERWRAKQGEVYWYLSSPGLIHQAVDNRYYEDNFRYSIGNYFKTEEEARKYIGYLEALQTIKDDAKWLKPDPGNKHQVMFAGHYDKATKNISYHQERADFIHQGAVYFASSDDIKHSQEIHRQEWLTVLGVKK